MYIYLYISDLCIYKYLFIYIYISDICIYIYIHLRYICIFIFISDIYIYILYIYICIGVSKMPRTLFSKCFSRHVGAFLRIYSTFLLTYMYIDCSKQKYVFLTCRNSGFHPSRLLFERDPTVHDLLSEKSIEYIMVVDRDTISVTYDVQDFSVCDVVGVYNKGMFATLQHGFWLVADRVGRVKFKESLGACIQEVIETATVNSQNSLTLGEEDFVDASDLPPLEDRDRVGIAIALLSHQSTVAEQMMDTINSNKLSKAGQGHKVVKEVMKNCPGWQSSVLPAKQWKKCEHVLRGWRSNTHFVQIHDRLKEAIPVVVQKGSADEFHEWLKTKADEHEDIWEILSHAGFQSTSPGNMLSMAQFCATALSEIAGVAWRMNDTVKYLKIGSGHEITVCAILGSIGISEHF